MKIIAGTDLLKLERIGKILQKSPQKVNIFLNRVFLPEELERIKYLNKGKERGFKDFRLKAASGFAAKEAAAKALGTGLWRQGVSFHSFRLKYDAAGKPHMEFAGAAQEKARELAIMDSALSLSHDGAYVVAFFTAICQNQGLKRL